MLDAIPFFFALGAVSRFVKSGLRLPPALFETLSIYLLLSIGLRGGTEIAQEASPALLVQALAAVGIGLCLPLLGYPLFRLRFNRADAASLAAHYGSVSIVTFAVASTVLGQQGVEFEGTMALLAALMEAPALITGTLLARLGKETPAAGVSPHGWGHLAHEVLANKSVPLLAGGIVIGYVAGPTGMAPLKPLFTDLFKGALCLFLLEMGLIAAEHVGDLRRAGLFLLGGGIGLSLVQAMVGWGVAHWLGLSLGGTVLLMTLSASASYIAAPTAMRLAIPEANPVLGVAAALGITFPFNVALGIPLYLWLARTLAQIPG